MSFSIFRKAFFIYLIDICRSIFWPGGQALSRYILDGGRDKFLTGKRVLDLGCGSGAASLAALKAGAKKPVYANDIDQVSQFSDYAKFDIHFVY